ncbi:MAG: ribonuclease III [Planctomycetes bacterium]|nr:ribonuclease III [Planctomycetota bacterium]
MQLTDHVTVEPPPQDGVLLEQCEEVLQYTFRDKQLLAAALTHASGADSRLTSNERLEFLGDAILGFVVCELLYHRFPDYLEGDLTRIKSVVVSRLTCAKISSRLQLEQFVVLGKGLTVHTSMPGSVLADLFESLVAAIYLDGGIEAARRFIVEHVTPEMERAAQGEINGNFKSHLQQLSQKQFGRTPSYVLLDEKGPDHSKCFKMSALIGEHRYTPAWGRNKKEAEQRAALNALSELQGEPAPCAGD